MFKQFRNCSVTLQAGRIAKMSLQMNASFECLIQIQFDRTAFCAVEVQAKQKCFPTVERALLFLEYNWHLSKSFAARVNALTVLSCSVTVQWSLVGITAINHLWVGEMLWISTTPVFPCHAITTFLKISVRFSASPARLRSRWGQLSFAVRADWHTYRTTWLSCME